MTQEQVRFNASVVPEERNLLLRTKEEVARFECGNRLARVSVRDRSRGIPPEEQGTCSNLSAVARASADMRSRSGLGLFIARRVLEAGGGSISLRPSKRGSRFVLELPAEGWQLCAS
jgi:signal transduction histidine kinase